MTSLRYVGHSMPCLSPFSPSLSLSLMPIPWVAENQVFIDLSPTYIYTHTKTQIRASTPMFLMSRKIKARGVKMVLSGEGADEIFGGYLYFHKAPNAK